MLKPGGIFGVKGNITAKNADNAVPIAEAGGIEALARAMTNHADDRDVQYKAVYAFQKVVWDIRALVVMAQEAGVVPLLQHAAGQGIERAATQLVRMGV